LANKKGIYLEIYLVGGYVRDKLLGFDGSDRDFVVVNSSVEEMYRNNFVKVGKDFPVFIDQETREEYALARRDKKTGVGYKGFMFEIEDVKLEEDLYRRDLTINAMAMSRDGDLIDPYGGQIDLEKKILRHVSNAFSEDPLRVLRLARFKSRFPDFSIAPETIELVHKIRDSGELDTLTPERVYLEIEKSLKKGEIYVFFQTLQDLGVLENIFPEVENFKSLKKIAMRSPIETVFALLPFELTKRLKTPKKVLHFSEIYQGERDLKTAEGLHQFFNKIKSCKRLKELVYFLDLMGEYEKNELARLFILWKDLSKSFDFKNLEKGTDINKVFTTFRILELKKNIDVSNNLK
jgi:tRNA nucleotidyltransferase/poly(A) polymerase